jgi:hypothetical protein
MDVSVKDISANIGSKTVFYLFRLKPFLAFLKHEYVKNW